MSKVSEWLKKRVELYKVMRVAYEDSAIQAVQDDELEHGEMTITLLLAADEVVDAARKMKEYELTGGATLIYWDKYYDALYEAVDRYDKLVREVTDDR